MPGAVAGVDYSTRLAASGGIPPYRWSNNAPLRCCVNVDPSGGIAGYFLYVSPGPYVDAFTVNVADSAGQGAAANLSITITGVHISPRSFPGATVGTPYSAPFQVAGGTPPYRIDPGLGVDPVTWGLPPGLHLVADPNGPAPSSCRSIDPGTICYLSGTPSKAGTFKTSIGASDASNRVTDWMTFTITVS